MSRDPLNRETLSHETLGNEVLDSDEFDSLDAVNDDHYGKSKPSKADSLRARRQVEAWLEERRLQRAIEDDWDEEE
ncbi:PA3496 family putative envelope integrity protein [Vreelandella sulfidaeris]|uniref:PA3496 family putative envelope integrity protein n=1 Tax=Vreelandella sulfidaeris TaxID=115553 RepID=UPI0035EDBA8F|tara:strand:- start:12211 stop:12438 length:228 start_codon:yes stop_codon:yes gene_type:complete